ncbi:aldo/keto reductase [Demequina muriae]|uniref:Aldo/keto reductase n=1 Tax=Demequina muriae TaxID=3051664 RepID=A0ABT8GEL4_9MICO|nr:aldo/keto reductase [Demequina sp. EGI L300058]MDN4479878.1 aldo/keto reductase [Demequina sp. EGI L300058]
MEQRTLGSAPFAVSAIGLGCNNFGRQGTASQTQEGTDAVIHAALDAGVTFFDTADLYGGEWGLSESLMGHALKGRRDEAIVATKFGFTEVATPLDERGAKGSRAYLRAACEASLERLQTDRLDLFQQHQPDPATPIEETIGALSELIDEGKIRAYGVSQFTAEQLTQADAAATGLGVPAIASSQDELSLVARAVETDGRFAAAERIGAGFLPFFPLANGLFTGKFTRTDMPADSRIARQRPHIAEQADWDAMEAYQRLCDEWGVTMLEATFGWFLSRAAVSSVIAGATRPEQIRQNAASASWRPAPDHVTLIEALFPA